MVSGRIDQSTIDAARTATSLVGMVARRVKLRRTGRGWSGLCPFHAEKTASFTVSDDKGFYHCFGCGAHGGAIDWVMETEGCAFVEAVERLLGGQLPDARRALPEGARRPSAGSGQARFDCVGSMTAARWIFETSGPARGEIVEAWLESRGLDPLLSIGTSGWPGGGVPIDQPINQLRFHPRCPVAAWRVDADPHAARLTAPAMVAPIRDADGANWGVHVTYLSGDGRSKAALPPVQGRPRPTRKMFGKVAGKAVWLSGDLSGENLVASGAEPTANLSAPLVVGSPSDEGGGGPPDPRQLLLVVGEGIETVWAFVQSFGKPCRAVATLSLENLQGGAMRLQGGALPLWRPEADPDRPPFLLSPCGSPAHQPRSLGPGAAGLVCGAAPGPASHVGDVIILIDADMKPLLGQKVQRRRKGPVERSTITSLERAELCATLAAQAWRRAGASKVTAVRPRMGDDFNDALGAPMKSSPPMQGLRGSRCESVGDGDEARHAA